MSGVNSPNSRISTPILAEAFDGCADLLLSWQRGLTPDPDLTVSEWADQHRFLSSRGAAEPGRYRTSRTPYLREIMDALAPNSPVQRVIFMKSAQIGATEAGLNWIGFVIHHAPGPMMWVLPSIDLAKRNSRQRLEPLIAESPALRELMQPSRSREAGNAMLSKEFPGGILVMVGANSPSGLRNMPARYVFMDEVDAYQASSGIDGDPVGLVEKRTGTFSHRRKIFLVSTPNIKGISRIEAAYEASDQRRFFVACPHCRADQWLKFDRLRWEKGRPKTAVYHCEACETPIAEHHKTAMLDGGFWRGTAVSADEDTIGFHLSGLYSPIGWLSWADIAGEWEAAQGSDNTLKVFRNTVLGETWFESGDAPEWQRLYEGRLSWDRGTVPKDGLYLTAGADVQKDRIEVDIWAWGRGLESWLVDHIVIEGGPGDPASWAQMTALVGRTFRHAGGKYMGISKLAIDTGYEGPAVHAWARGHSPAQVLTIKGEQDFNRAMPVSDPVFLDAKQGGKVVRRGASRRDVATSTFKVETYRFLRLPRPLAEDIEVGEAYPSGTIHLPDWIDLEWLKQLVAEQLITVRNRRGFSRMEWQKVRERNEALDNRIYARAASWVAGIDRWAEYKWVELERELAAPVVEAPVAPARRAATEWIPKVDTWI